tara:strand:+ start:406 stop:606 length:201 start_codon:yes stop_codon:yes gene_type:complete
MSKHTDILLDAVQEIAAIIYYQSSLKDQDRWLNNIMDKGIWLPEEDDNTTYHMSVEETLKNMEDNE